VVDLGIVPDGKTEEDLGDIPMEEDLDLKQVIVLFNRDKSGRCWDSS
jgi:hypothetical protein